MGLFFRLKLNTFISAAMVEMLYGVCITIMPMQMHFGMKPASGVDQQNVDPAAFRRLNPVEDNGRRVRAGLMLDDIDANPLAPDIELFDGGSAKSVARNQQDFFSDAAILRGEFADGRGLADTVHAEKENHPWLD